MTNLTGPGHIGPAQRARGTVRRAVWRRWVQRVLGRIPWSSGAFVPGRDGHQIIANRHGRGAPNETLELTNRFGAPVVLSQIRYDGGSFAVELGMFPVCVLVGGRPLPLLRGRARGRHSGSARNGDECGCGRSHRPSADWRDGAHAMGRRDCFWNSREPELRQPGMARSHPTHLVIRPQGARHDAVTSDHDAPPR